MNRQNDDKKSTCRSHIASTMGLLYRRKRRPWSVLDTVTLIYYHHTLVGRVYGTSSSSSDKNKGLLDVQSFCKANTIKVKSFRLLCDSPGAYYYGSNTYRNSQVCMSNDTANLRIHCE
jgi:hypothetical protein